MEQLGDVGEIFEVRRLIKELSYVIVFCSVLFPLS